MFVLNEECGAPQCQKIVRQADLSLTLPWEGEGRLTLSGAKRETGWGDLSTRAPFETIDFPPTPPLISFASTLPLQGRVRAAYAAALLPNPNASASSVYDFLRAS